MTFFDNHSHTEYSNLRLLDATNKPEALVNKAIELGLSGIAITDHESLASHIKVNKLAKTLQSTHPDFTVALGNEIYLTDTRDQGQRYYHFILIAKDAIGYRALKELSSTAWYNSYFDRGMERVPLLKSELSAIMKDYKGHVIGTTACIGGELGTCILNLTKCEKIQDIKNAKYYHDKIVDLITFCIDTFGKDDFYIEVAPACSEEQIIVNQRALAIALAFKLNMSIGCDAHYLTAEDRYVHKAYLNSKGGEREVDIFYEYAHLMNPEEARNNLRKGNFDEATIDWIFNCTETMRKSIQFYSLEHSQQIPEVEVTDYPKSAWWGVNNDDADEMSNYPELQRLFTSDNIQERYWVNECWNALQEKKGYWADNLKYVERLNEEARVKRVIGEKLGTCMFAYPNTLKHYVDLFWECGSTVGAGRGSACAALNHYLLGITQLDPIEWDLPFWRYINDERTELGDIDLDLAPSKIQAIFAAIRAERGELGLVQVCTFGTEGTKSAILTACRGYRSNEYPDGIDVDDAQYLSSLIPSERGFLWPIEDVVNGNPEKGRKPVQAFIVAVNQYPGLLDIITRIQGLVNKRSSHASGVILFDENIYDSAAIMRTPKGALITQWDLHDQEAAGSVKYDFLLTAVQDIIIQTISLLQADKVIEPELSLREVYNKYLHPSVLPQDSDAMWDALANGDVLGCFQFDSSVGAQAAKKIRPRNPLEMADANGLMRLMTAEKGQETPLDKYVRFKNDISQWYKEMTDAGLTKQEQKVLEPYFKSSYGVPPSQEQLMKMLQDPDICGFKLAEANDARKIVGKKQMNRIPELHEKVCGRAASKALGDYVWRCGIGPQMGYSFSIIHALAYSFIGMQTLYLATHFNPVYWNTAYLIVNSGAIDAEASEQTDYTKLAKAIGEIRNAGIQVSLADINHSSFEFIPDVENNQILFGLKGMANVNNDLIKEIIEHRPYASLYDFMHRVNANKQAMISLIKGGAFDQFANRKANMVEYIWLTCDKKKRLTLQNMPGLMRYGLVPQDTEERITARRIYEFNRYLKAECKADGRYKLDDRAITFLTSIEKDHLIIPENNNFYMSMQAWDNVYQKWMDVFRSWIRSDTDNILMELNTKIFMDDWNKYAKGNVSSWEMEALCFYYHDHELAHVDNKKYGFSDFFSLGEEPVVERVYGGRIPIYKLYTICGTCIAKNKTKSTVYLLTTTGVVAVKFRQEYFALFDKQTFQRNPDGTKKVVERSWFNRGNMIVVNGIRRGDEFIPKKYAATAKHQLYHIDAVNPDGTINLRSERYTGEEEEDNNDN